MKYILVFLVFWTSISMAQDTSLIIKNTGNTTIVVTPGSSDGDRDCTFFGACHWRYGEDNKCNNILHNTYNDALIIAPKKQYQIVNGSELEDGWWDGGLKARYCKYIIYNTNSNQAIGLRVSNYKTSTCVLTKQSGSIDALYDNNEVIAVTNGTGKNNNDEYLCDE